jgi:hypothetical protein
MVKTKEWMACGRHSPVHVVGQKGIFSHSSKSKLGVIAVCKKVGAATCLFEKCVDLEVETVSCCISLDIL